MLMTGTEYLQSIRDGRVIYVGSERITDQTTHPAFANGARTYAALFDMKSDPALRDVMTFEERGERYNTYYLQPRSQDDLRRRNRAHRRIADFCFGLMGRTPDAVAGNITGLSMKPEVFDSEPGGNRSNAPDRMSDNMPSCVSAGIATSHGSIHWRMRSSPIMSHGCTSTGMRSLAQ